MEFFDANKWKRLETSGLPVYVDPETPDWVVPSKAGDELFMQLKQSPSMEDFNRNFLCSSNGNTPLQLLKSRQFLSLFPNRPPFPYTGRYDFLTLDRLFECWFHLTDHCNLSCRHCLFSCSPKTRQTLRFKDFEKTFSEVYNLGARTFYLTGGEPLLHPDFENICSRILRDTTDGQLMILTNGLLLPRFKQLFDRLDKSRLHLQISLDGPKPVHDHYRGMGTFDNLMEVLDSQITKEIDVSLAMAVFAKNVEHMADTVSIAARCAILSVHYLWLFVTGKAAPDLFVSPEILLKHLVDAENRGQSLGVTIDNVKTMESRVFSPAGIKYDLGNAGWESLAIGPDGSVYPTPAMIGRQDVLCGHIRQGMETVWRNSPMLETVRRLSVINDKTCNENPLKYIVGGEDIDHSYYSGNRFTGADPYVPLYNGLALYLIRRSAQKLKHPPYPNIVLKMGDRLLQCGNSGSRVALTHSNCVLSLPGARDAVGNYYGEAAREPKPDIANPVCYPEDEIRHIPPFARVRSYGCGSPVMDAGIEPGESVVDLGSGAGVECFIASKKTGPQGNVSGIDMLDPMLELANRAKESIHKNLGYENVSFKKGFLEDIPLPDNQANVVISNCVINLSEDKQQTFSEIFRILKPDGRLVVSDVESDSPPSPEIQNDASLRGECIAGAMEQNRLMAMLEILGFVNIRIIKRFFYRNVKDHRFYSLTYRAYKPNRTTLRSIVYPGPYAGVITDDGNFLLRGEKSKLSWPVSPNGDKSVLFLDEWGSVDDPELENACDCSIGPETIQSARPSRQTIISPEKSPTGCLKCGKPVRYPDKEEPMVCIYCENVFMANAVCESNHFICDSCHVEDALAVIDHICKSTGETDLITLMNTIHNHPSIPVHGPEHHIAVPAVIVSTYRNMGGLAGNPEIDMVIGRAKSLPGGSCAFWGACGAALGAGIAFGVLLESTPLKGAPRKTVQQIVAELISGLTDFSFARCCQRESWTILKKTAEMSKHILPVPLKAEGNIRCRQKRQNRECPGNACPYY